jgi:hypothetical protein
MHMNNMTVHQIGRTLTEGAHKCEMLGVSLEIGTMEELELLNRANSDSWRPLLPIFSSRHNRFAPGTTICWLGRANDNHIVLAQAARLFDWRDTNFHIEAESLRLFYSRKPILGRTNGESIKVTAPQAHKIRGVVAYTGAHWVHPSFRGKGLTSITPRMMRAMAIAAWNVDLCCTIMADDIFKRNVAARAGYPNCEWAVTLKGTPTGSFPAALLWATRAEILQSLSTPTPPPKLAKPTTICPVCRGRITEDTWAFCASPVCPL